MKLAAFAEPVQQRLEGVDEIGVGGNVPAFVMAKTLQHPGVVVAMRAGVKLHDHAVVA